MFGRLSLVGTVANLVAVPVAGLVMLFGLPACLVAGAVPAVGAGASWRRSGWGVWWVDAVATVAAAARAAAAVVVARLGLVVGVVVAVAGASWRRRRDPAAMMAGPMAVHLLTGDDESILRAAVTDLVHELVGDGDRSLMVDEFDGEDVRAAAPSSTPPRRRRSSPSAGSSSPATSGGSPPTSWRRSSPTSPTRCRRPSSCSSAAAGGCRRRSPTP